MILTAMFLVGLATATASYVKAQQADVFEIVVPADSLLAKSGSTTLGESLRRITAYANNEECVSVAVAAVTSDVVLALGTEGQPATCQSNGSIVTFVDGQGRPLAVQMTLELGTRQTLTNLAPSPPGSVPFVIVIPGEILSQPTGQADRPATLGEFLERLTAYANNTSCMSINVSTEQDAVFYLGLPSQPAECSAAGATVTFVDGDGRQLAEQVILIPGNTAILSNLAPGAPNEAVPSAVSTVPSSEIKPPATGDAGLAGAGLRETAGP